MDSHEIWNQGMSSNFNYVEADDFGKYAISDCFFIQKKQQKKTDDDAITPILTKRFVRNLA